MVYIQQGKYTVVATNNVSHNAQLTFWLEAWAENYDLVNNSTKVWTRVTVQCTSGSASTSSLTVSGDGLSYSNSGVFTISNNGSWQTIVEGYFIAHHNSDGTKTMNISATISANQSWWNNTLSGTITLPTIPRSSGIALSPSTVSCDGYNSFTISINRASEAFTHNVYYLFGNNSSKNLIAQNVATSCSWTPPRELLLKIPNDEAGVGAIIVETFSGGTKLGDSSTRFYISSVGVSEPRIENITVTELNSSVSGSGVFGGISKKKISFDVYSYDGSSIKRVTVTNGSQTVNAYKQGDSDYISHGKKQRYSVTLSNLTSGDFEFEVLDSRGYRVTTQIGDSFQTYFKPILTQVEVNRDKPTGSSGTLKIKGKWFKLSSNNVFVSYKRTTENDYSGSSKSGSFNLNINSDGSFEASVNFSDLEYTKTFRFTITAKDSFGGLTIQEVILPSSQYVAWLGKNTVSVPILHVFKRKNTPCGIYNEGDLSVKGNSYFSGNLNVSGKLNADISDSILIKKFTTYTSQISSGNSDTAYISLSTPYNYKFVGILGSYMIGSGIMNYVIQSESDENTAKVYLGNTWNGWTYPGGQVGVTVVYIREQ